MPEAEGDRSRPLVGRREELAGLDAALDALRSPGARWLVRARRAGDRQDAPAGGAVRSRAGARVPGAGRARRRRWSATCRSASGSPRSTTTSPRSDPTASRALVGDRAGRARAGAAVGRAATCRSAGSRTSASAPIARCARCSWRLAARQPLVVVLDDLHWADEASLELIVHLLRRPAPARILTALAFREGQLPGAGARRARGGGARQQRRASCGWRRCRPSEADALMGEQLPAAVRQRGLPPERRQPVLPAGAGRGSGPAEPSADEAGRRAGLGVRRARAGDRRPGRARAAAGLGRGRRGRSGRSRPGRGRRRA